MENNPVSETLFCTSVLFRKTKRWTMSTFRVVLQVIRHCQNKHRIVQTARLTHVGIKQTRYQLQACPPSFVLHTGQVLVSLSLSLSVSVLHRGDIQHAFQTVSTLVAVYKHVTCNMQLQKPTSCQILHKTIKN